MMLSARRAIWARASRRIHLPGLMPTGQHTDSRWCSSGSDRDVPPTSPPARPVLSKTSLARQWREAQGSTSTTSRRSPSLRRAADFIRCRSASLASWQKPTPVAATPESVKPAAASMEQLVDTILSDPVPPSATAGSEPRKSVDQGLSAFRDSLTRAQVSEAIHSATKETSTTTSSSSGSGAATTAGGSGAHAHGSGATAHERHRRHLLDHVDIRFALQTLRIHVFTFDDGTEWIDVYLGPHAADALRKRHAASSSQAKSAEGGEAQANDQGAPEVKESELLDVYHAAIAVLLQEHNVHDTLIEDAMERLLLPQAVLLEDCCALVLRSLTDDDDDSPRVADSLQSLTHRLSVFLFSKKVITLHRPDLPACRGIRRRFETRFKGSTKAHLVNALVYGCLQSFRKEVTRATVEFDALEAQLFNPQEKQSELARDMYLIKRRAAICARVVSMSAEAYTYAASFLGVSNLDGYYQDVIHEFSQVKMACEELNDSAHTVMQLLFQLSSYQLNELMRVLTMFSAFFIPLTFIAGVYGMNFPWMPFLNDPNGSLYCGAVMAMVGATVLLWFRLQRF